MSGPIRTQVAGATPFDNSTNGFVAADVQAAIEEAKTAAGSKGRFSITAGFDGNATVGRYLEFNSNVDSNQSGFLIPRDGTLRECSLAIQTNAAVTVQLRTRAGTVLQSISTTANTRTNILTGLNLILTANTEYTIYISAGSCARPITWWFIEPS
jgi:hypothetical protein